MKIFGTIANAPVMTEQEVDKFLESKLNLRLATIDEMDDPNIQLIRFYYDKSERIFLIVSSKISKFRIFAGNPTHTFLLTMRTFHTRVLKAKV